MSPATPDASTGDHPGAKTFPPGPATRGSMTPGGPGAPTLADVAPEDVGVDPAALDRAVALAVADEPDLPRDMRAWLATTLASEPWPHIMGPVRDRAEPSGVAIVGGRTIARWGRPEEPDMAFSIAKSALALVAGVARRDGRLTDLDRPAVLDVPLEALGGTVPAGGRPGIVGPDRFGGRGGTLPGGVAPDGPEHDAHRAAARRITWRHLLTQSSDWRGSLYDVPWWADPQGRQPPDEPVHGPGARYAYNDIRTNLCSLALTHLNGASGLEVLRDRVLVPIGGAPDVRWHGLDGMRTTLTDGRTVDVVTGGSHWGGGLWTTATDLARLGLLVLADGHWGGERILDPAWCRAMVSPSVLRPAYGLMWWRNPAAGLAHAVPGVPGAPPVGAVADHQAHYPGSSVRGFAAHGTGDQVVWCDPDRDLVVVLRWSAAPEPILAAFTAAVPATG
ncbi:MAG: serine hydrolase domain-containing protein [Solirubrobacteraceae bacterium]